MKKRAAVIGFVLLSVTGHVMGMLDEASCNGILANASEAYNSGNITAYMFWGELWLENCQGN